MFVAPLFGAAVLVAVAADPFHDATGDTNRSMQEKAAAIEPLVRSATQCIVCAVTAVRTIKAGSAQKLAISSLVICPCVSHLSAP